VHDYCIDFKQKYMIFYRMLLQAWMKNPGAENSARIQACALVFQEKR
jgi:hypothetical protein